MGRGIAFIACLVAAVPSSSPQEPPVQLLVDAFSPTRLQYRFVVPAIDTDSPVNGFLGYELRYSEDGPVDAATWGAATILVPLTDPGVPAKAEAGGAFDSYEPIFWRSETYHVGLRYRYWDCAGPERWSEVYDTPVNWDAVPPGRINDLRIVSVTSHSLRFEWTAPGDDGILDGGPAEVYEFHYSARPPAEADAKGLAAWWGAPTTRVAAGLPVPAAPGSSQQFELKNLAAGARIFAAMRAADERGNWGPISFHAVGFTLQGNEVYTGTDGSSVKCGTGGAAAGTAFLLLPALFIFRRIRSRHC